MLSRFEKIEKFGRRPSTVPEKRDVERKKQKSHPSCSVLALGTPRGPSGFDPDL